MNLKRSKMTVAGRKNLNTQVELKMKKLDNTKMAFSLCIVNIIRKKQNLRKSISE